VTGIIDHTGTLRRNVIFAAVLALLAAAVTACAAPRAPHPSLIPAPQSVEWTGVSFGLDRPVRVVLSADCGPEVETAADLLANGLLESGAKTVAIAMGDPHHPIDGAARIAIGPVEGGQGNPEAYALEVSGDFITLTAPGTAGLFHGIQTLRQLAGRREGPPALAGCRITDRPAFPMRGIMFDVGRNFISLPLIKEYMDVLAQYKLNVFHFHLTEHIGWRLQIESHPELTAPEHQIRNKGKFYTRDDIRDLLAFCRERHIMVIPEIDMPGHSEAFVRATGHRMESPEGMAILADVLTEVCDLFDAPYVHLGSDEVRITNPGFIPAMAKVVRDRGKEVVLWRPGGPLDAKSVYQLWSTGKAGPGERVIDSRDFYLNHLDWFSGVRHVFNSAICGVPAGSDRHLGGITCLWPDRRVAHEEDQFRMSPVAPVLLTFAERTWLGGGYPDLRRELGAPGSPEYKGFAEFEERLIRHRDLYFADKPFVHVRQSDVVWCLFGPFPNKGDLEQAFPPEEGTAAFYEYEGKRYEPRMTRGATVLLGGWGDDGIYGRTANHTAYAETHVHADAARDAWMLIGFRSWSRSHRDSTPRLGEWDHRRSWIRLNGQPIAPPRWARPGRKGDHEDPLIDEGYAYRPPTPVRLTAGWNRILVKAPVGKDVVKWMFTAVLVSWDGERVRELEGVTYSAAPE